MEVADIGFPGQALEAVKEAEGTAAGDFAVTYSDDDLKRIPRRPAYSNKGTFGKVLIVAGSKNMCGPLPERFIRIQDRGGTGKTAYGGGKPSDSPGTPA